MADETSLQEYAQVGQNRGLGKFEIIKEYRYNFGRKAKDVVFLTATFFPGIGCCPIFYTMKYGGKFKWAIVHSVKWGNRHTEKTASGRQFYPLFGHSWKQEGNGPIDLRRKGLKIYL